MPGFHCGGDGSRHRGDGGTGIIVERGGWVAAACVRGTRGCYRMADVALAGEDCTRGERGLQVRYGLSREGERGREMEDGRTFLLDKRERDRRRERERRTTCTGAAALGGRDMDHREVRA
jgi:hypothetical protein